MCAYIAGIEYYLPNNTLSNKDLEKIYDKWSAAKVEEKTGIRERHIASQNETASDLGFYAGEKIFKSGLVKRSEIDFLLFCTESPDYPVPPCACVLQDRLGIPVTAGALDYNLGCSGFIYGLGLADGLIASGQAKRVLLITAETYSKYIHPDDQGVRSIFGDGAAATLISVCESRKIGPFVYGTDGSGYKNLIVAQGGSRSKCSIDNLELSKLTDYPNNLYMNGPEIFNFTIKSVPTVVANLIEKSSTDINEIDYFVFHQANQYMLEHLRKKIHIEKNKFYNNILSTGNTVSSSIPIALKDAHLRKLIKNKNLVMLVGFGVGYSWGATLVRWNF